MTQRFQIGDHIGSGGFGTVEEAVRLDECGNETGPELARKALLPEWASDADALSRFKREVRLMDEMGHPNIVPVLARNLSDSPPWFVMPRADTSLAHELRGGPADEDWVISTFTAVLNGMAYAHSKRRILHRDLKPENILFIGDVPTVSDFGLGKRLDPNSVDLTATNLPMGTMNYMAPEQFNDAAHVGQAADVYALGKILWEMLTGEKPSVLRPRIDAAPERFRSFIDKCAAEFPADRYANAADALAAFRLLVYGDTGDIEDLLREWEGTPVGENELVRIRIAELLVEGRDDEEFFVRVVPRLPDLLLQQLLTTRPHEWNAILRAYNEHIQGALPFEYCDVVANFYRRLFLETASPEHRELVLVRLIELGPTHNRWHVGHVVAELLTGIEDSATAEMAAQAIRYDSLHARWFNDYVANRSLHPRIAEAFASLRPGTADDL